MTTAACVSLDSVRPGMAGGKAEGLARLLAHGFDVPQAFVVLGASPGELPADLETHYRRLGETKVAVRSSAAGEDSRQASFAGQYETFLDVEGVEQLRAAVEQCLGSAASARSATYRKARLSGETAPMSVVVQTMVRARVAGVCFTANPINARRDQIVIDAVSGLGEELVSGRVTPDHWVLNHAGTVIHQECRGTVPVLREAEIELLVEGARRAERELGEPLDLEWAIDETGKLWWLQARPITSLCGDLNELDTEADSEHVYTWANIGEMMPGAVTPLTYSITGRGIDFGMQRTYRRIGAQIPPGDAPRYVGMFFGHLFINLTTLAELSAHVAGSTKRQMCLAICGRDVAEVADPKPRSRWRRAFNGVRYFALLIAASKHRKELDALRSSFTLPHAGSAAQLYYAIDRELPRLWKAYELHLLSSASSGALSPILLGILSKGGEPSQADHAELAWLLSGAEDVESTDIAEGIERIVARLLEHPSAAERFANASPDTALDWLRSDEAGPARQELDRYLARHGHRAVRELELRQNEWSSDPMPLIRSLQAAFAARLRARETRVKNARPAPSAAGRPALARLLPLAHAAIRSREHTKSALVEVTTKLKHGYRALGSRLVDEGLLPDPDAVFFLMHSELGELLRGRRELSDVALQRRRALDHQMQLQFPQVFKGKPTPLDVVAPSSHEGALVGKPVSRGKARGRARVVESLEDAAALQAGEILIAPITDVGWTPYFTLIAGLATDVGSAVSHGAVVAREYGLPAVVNLGTATRRFQTGDLVVLDADAGTLRLA